MRIILAFLALGLGWSMVPWAPLPTIATVRAQGEPSTAASDETWMKAKGDFGAMLLLTTDPEAFLKAWSPRKRSGSQPPEPPEAQLADKVSRGETLEAFVLFRGCTPDALGECSAETSFVVLRPDGALYARLPGAELWKGKAPPPKEVLRLGVASLELEIEPQDPLGMYTLQARVCDRNSGACLDLSETFEATEAILSW